MAGSGHGTAISLADGESKRLDLAFKRFIHLTSPIDNAFSQEEARIEAFQAPTELRWDPFPEAASYQITVWVCDTVPCNTRENARRLFTQSVQETQFSLNLPRTKAQKHIGYTCRPTAVVADLFILRHAWGARGWWQSDQTRLAATGTQRY